MIISGSVLPRMTTVLDKFYREIQNEQDFLPENRTVCEIMWGKNIVHPDRPRITTRHMRIACWVSKAIDTHSKYVIRIALSRQQW